MTAGCETALRASLPQQQAEAANQSPSMPALTGVLQRAANQGWNVETELPKVVGARAIPDGADPAAVLHDRLTRFLGKYRADMDREPEQVLDLCTRPCRKTPLSPDMAEALGQRETAMESRAFELLQRAAKAREPWLRHLGPEPRMDRYSNDR